MMDIDVQFARGDFELELSCRTDAPIVGVFGPSGAGKSTLIELIAGLARPDRGRIAVDGDVLFEAGRINVPVHRRRIGVVFQEHRLFPHRTVHRNLLYGAGRDNRHVDEIIDLLELRNLLERRPSALSGGERQRVALGRTLISNPRLLLLDEPLASLDHRLRGQVLAWLRRAREIIPIPMLYVSHELTELLQLTDELIVMDAGRAVGQGRYAELVHDAAVQDVVHDRGMVNLFKAKVAATHAAAGVSTLTVGSTELTAPLIDRAPGSSVTVTVQPWDVALASQTVSETSIRNQVPGTVTRCTHHDRRVLVEVDIGTSLVVEISHRSAESMAIAAGKSLVCLIKSHALRVVD